MNDKWSIKDNWHSPVGEMASQQELSLESEIYTQSHYLKKRSNTIWWPQSPFVSRCFIRCSRIQACLLHQPHLKTLCWNPKTCNTELISAIWMHWTLSSLSTISSNSLNLFVYNPLTSSNQLISVHPGCLCLNRTFLLRVEYWLTESWENGWRLSWSRVAVVQLDKSGGVLWQSRVNTVHNNELHSSK